jgi:hypothetical protein
MAPETSSGTPQRWSVAQIHALAPDLASQKAGIKLAAPGPWSESGASPAANLLWGDCKGSGAKPYQVTVELSAPAFACSCPSRKFPCKHALGLLLLWSAGTVPDAQALPQRVQEWLKGRDERAQKTEARKSAQAQKAAEAAEEPEAARKAASAAEKRTAQRAGRIDAGFDELELWLADQVRGGLTGLRGAGYQPLDGLARRLVDAQAPGAAARVKDLAPALSTPEWSDHTLRAFAQLNLLARGWRHRAQLPGPLAATVSRRVGLAPSTEELAAAGERVADRWLVLGLRDDTPDKLVERRVWLRGEGTGRTALLLAFAPHGQNPGLPMPVGSAFDACLAFAPEAVPLRAVVLEQGELRSCAPGVSGLPGSPASTGGTLEDAAAAFAAAVAADPWTTTVPALLEAAVAVRREAGERREWHLLDAKGSLSAPLIRPGAGESAMALGTARQDPDIPRLAYALLAAGEGRPAPVFGIYSLSGFAPVTVWSADGPVSLS